MLLVVVNLSFKRPLYQGYFPELILALMFVLALAHIGISAS